MNKEKFLDYLRRGASATSHFFNRAKSFTQDAVIQTEYLNNKLEKTDRQRKATFSKPREVGLAPNNRGWRYGAEYALSLDQPTFRMGAVIGNTGSGKSTKCINTLLASKNEASIVTRNTGGQEGCFGYIASQGYDIHHINVSEPEMSSDCFNPLEGDLDEAAIKRIAHILTKTSYSDKEDFWSLQAENICGTEIETLKKCFPPEFHTVYHLKILNEELQGDFSILDQRLGACDDEGLHRKWKAIFSLDEKVCSGALATIATTLSRLDSSLGRLMSTSTFRWEELRTKKKLIMITSNPADASYLGVFESLLYSQLLRVMLGDSKMISHKENAVLILLDEISSLSPSLGPLLEKCFLNLRKRNCGILACFQGHAALQSAFGENVKNVILDNCYSKLYLPGVSYSTCEQLSRMIGEEVIETKSGVKERRPYMTPYAIQNMNASEGLLFVQGYPCCKLHLQPFYSNYKMKRRWEIPAPPMRTLSDIVPIELPPLDLQPYGNLNEEN